MASPLAQYGPALLARGYPIVPIKAGTKMPGYKGWQRTVADADQLAAWLSNGYADGGVAVLAKDCPAIDIDVLDADVAGRVAAYALDLIGPTPIRTGRAPKRLLPFRADAPFSKMSSRKYVDLYGDEHKVEILGRGQQWVAYATHPDTRQPYSWSGGEAAEIALADLPVLTADAAREVIAFFEAIVPDDWAEVAPGAADAAPPSADPLDNMRPATDLTTRQVVDVLRRLDPNMSMAQWIRVGMGLHHQYGGGEDGFRLWDRWSAQSTKYNADEMRARWRSCAADHRYTRPTTFASVIAMTRDASLTVRPSADPTRRETGFRFLPAADVLATLGPINWRIEGYLETDATGVLFGDPETFKSFIALDMAFHVAAGRPWHGAPVRQGPVIYIAGEGHSGLARRFAAWGADRGVDVAALPFFTSSRAARLYDETHAQEVAAAVQAIADAHGAPALVVIDTLARNFGGEENSATDMGRFIDHVDTLLRAPHGATVLIVHHTGQGNKGRARGSYALYGGVDFEFRLDREPGAGAAKGMRTHLIGTKTKNAAGGAEAWFEGREIALATPGGEMTSSLVFDRSAAPVRAAPGVAEGLKGRQRELYELVETEQPVTRETLQEIALREEICPSAGAFRNTLKALREKGVVRENDKYISSLVFEQEGDE